ncbi:Peptidyl-prolyl cis-trans isomerase D [Buchnera aphidicola (Cinara piceae)]|uniref:Peptidyl-prolyl cis-trans isomerase D n=1 Tax=Buchnera aphidicola (Cinara piceae) TaxID=1660043 RepID=A0A803FU77_9GAMM|nr:SurA N-terminal domain-containing protein [Buchnera aphidicola]VFP88620.1 Peptidyl-prolyl cis-trans isomerase D [Buchnera aphidicola (Cinara piceae)]
MSLSNSFYKKNILITITTIIISSIILSNIAGILINKKELPFITINKEKIYYKILQLSYNIIKKKTTADIKNILHDQIKKKEYKQYVLQQIIIKIINEVLLKQYVNLINLNMLEKYAKDIIFSSKYFNINNSFNYKKYVKFINFIMHSHSQYINALKKKIAVQYLIKLLLKSIIILKEDIKNKFKKIINKKNIQIINFKIDLKKIEKKNNINDIEKYFHLNKEKFYKPESKIIKVTHLKKKQHIKNNSTQLTLKYIKKKIKKQKYNFNLIKINCLKIKNFFLNMLQKKKIYTAIKNKIFKKKNKKIRLGWIQFKNIPKIIKKFQLKKIGDYTKIIFYKNNFFIFKLNSVKKINNKNMCMIKNHIIKKNKHQKNVFKNIILNNMLSILLNENNLKLKNLLPKNSIKTYTKKIIQSSRKIKNDYLNTFNKYIKKIFFSKKKSSINQKIQTYTNKKKHIYLLQMKSYITKSLPEKKIIYKKILNNFALKKMYKKNYIYIKNLLLENYNKKNFFFNKNPIYTYNPQTLLFNNNNEIKQIIKQLPPIKNNKCIYIFFKTPKQQNYLIVFKKEFFEKIDKTEKYLIYPQIKQHLKIKVITTILQNLYKKSKITFNSN